MLVKATGLPLLFLSLHSSSIDKYRQHQQYSGPKGSCYKLGRPRGHDFTNIAVPRSILRVRSWTFDTWLSSGSSRHAKVDTEKNTFWCTFSQFEDQGNHSAGHMWAEKKKKVSTIGCLGELELNHVSNFRSKIQKLSGAQQKFSFPHFNSSLYEIFSRL